MFQLGSKDIVTSQYITIIIIGHIHAFMYHWDIHNIFDTIIGLAVWRCVMMISPRNRS